MAVQTKRQNRIMGEYSIAKSYKGILRIAHIVDLIQGVNDQFLNPAYYGSPKFRLDISGKSNSSKQTGVQSAIHALKGQSQVGISRYDFPEDELKNRRVPMTDSMGNYLNWNVGHDGVTIGSNDSIAGTSQQYQVFYQNSHKNHPIYQEKFFPVYKTNTIIVGKINKQHRSDNKSNINKGRLQLQQGELPAKLIIQNLYTKSYYEQDQIGYTSTGKQVKLRRYKNAINENPSQEQIDNPDKRNTFKKIRTIYNDTKETVQQYDVLMYQQNDWDCYNFNAAQQTGNNKDKKWHIERIGKYDNSTEYNKKFNNYEKGDLLDCNVDFVNIKKYLISKIEKFLNGNITQVPSGTIIWQYASLEKWRAYNDPGYEKASSFYQGNRPALQVRSQGDLTMPFYNTLVQGVCKKYNRLRKRAITGNSEQEKQDNQTTAMSIIDQDNFLSEIIPLYKRDYLLCDGSKYRLPFYPKFMSNNLAKHRQSFNRLFELFFNIGYKYTERKQMYNRPSVKMFNNIIYDNDGKVILGETEKDQNGNDKVTPIFLPVNSGGQFIIPRHRYNKIKSSNTPQNISINDFAILQDVSITVSDFDNLNDLDNCSWGNQGAIHFKNNPNSRIYHECQDIQVLFGQDLATMLAIDAIYEFFKHTPQNNRASYEDIMNHLKSLAIPQKYIFNSFIGHEKGIKVPYITKNIQGQDETYHINIGKQVNSYNSQILFYDNHDQIVRQVKVWQLPMIQFFALLLDSQHKSDEFLLQYLYSFYCYDFCVPSMTPNDGSSSFIGSGGYVQNDNDRIKVKKIIEWQSKYTHSTIPHRHAVFAGKSILDDLNQFKYSAIPTHYGMGQIDLQSPVNIAGWYGGEIHPFNKYNKKGYKLKYINDQNDNYIINQHHSTLDTVNINGMKVNILTNSGKNLNVAGLTEKGKNQGGRNYSWATGGHRKLTGDSLHVLTDKNKNRKSKQSGSSLSSIKNNQSQPNISFLGDIKLTQDNEYSNTKFLGDATKMSVQNTSDREQYYQINKHTWYGLSPYQDARFDTSQPNRGLSSKPIYISTVAKIRYQKTNQNKYGYCNGTEHNGQYGFFSPEHITMLPLIKI